MAGLWFKLLTKLPKRKKFSTISRRVRRRINSCSLFNNFNEVKFAFFSPQNYIIKVVRFFVSINTWCSYELFSLIPVLSLLDKSMKKSGFQIPLDNDIFYYIFSRNLYLVHLMYIREFKMFKIFSLLFRASLVAQW